MLNLRTSYERGGDKETFFFCSWVLLKTLERSIRTRIANSFSTLLLAIIRCVKKLNSGTISY